MESDELMKLLREYRAKAFNPHSGKSFAYVYTLENEKFKSVEKAYDMFSGDNDLEGTNDITHKKWFVTIHSLK